MIVGYSVLTTQKLSQEGCVFLYIKLGKIISNSSDFLIQSQQSASCSSYHGYWWPRLIASSKCKFISIMQSSGFLMWYLLTRFRKLLRRLGDVWIEKLALRASYSLWTHTNRSHAPIFAPRAPRIGHDACSNAAVLKSQWPGPGSWWWLFCKIYKSLIVSGVNQFCFIKFVAPAVCQQP